MNRTRKLLLLPSVASVLLVGCAHHYKTANYPPPPAAQGPDAFFQHGLHDGFNAARHDVQHNDPPNFERHRNFRNPPVPRKPSANTAKPSTRATTSSCTSPHPDPPTNAHLASL